MLWFDDLPVVGALSPKEAAVILRQIGEDEVAYALENIFESPSHTFAPGTRKHWWSLPDKLWLHTAHAFGYLAPALPGNNSLQNQVPEQTEDVHFSATYRVLDGNHTAIRGNPIFIGLHVGNEGVSFKCRTINVKNDQNEVFLDFLESDVFTTGLKLATTAQPAIAPLSALTLGLAKAIAKRHRNISVRDFDLGFDFSTLPMRAHLSEGSYLAVQMPESLQPIWNWDEWVYHPASGQVVKRANHHETIPYNYLVFGVSRYEGN